MKRVFFVINKDIKWKAARFIEIAMTMNTTGIQ